MKYSNEQLKELDRLEKKLKEKEQLVEELERKRAENLRLINKEYNKIVDIFTEENP